MWTVYKVFIFELKTWKDSPWWSSSVLSVLSATHRIICWFFSFCKSPRSFLIFNFISNGWFLKKMDSVWKRDWEDAGEIVYMDFSKTFDEVYYDFLEGNREKN